MPNTKKTTKAKKKINTVKEAKGAKSRRIPEPTQYPAVAENNAVRYILGIISLLLSVLVTVSYFVQDAKFLDWISSILSSSFGIGYYVFGPSMLLLSWCILFADNKQRILRSICSLFIPLIFCSLVGLFGNQGGSIGSAISKLGSKYISNVGFGIIFGILLVFCCLKGLGANASSFKVTNKAVTSDEPKIFNKPSVSVPISKNKPIVNTQTKRAADYNIPLGIDYPEKVNNKKNQTKTTSIIAEERKNTIIESTSLNQKQSKSIKPIRQVDITASKPEDITNDQKRITKQEITEATKDVAKEIANKEDNGTYVFPSINLLNYSKGKGSDSDSFIQDTQLRLENALHSFGINSYVTSITQGPTVTRYDIELEQGIKLSKVTNLSGDIALALGVLNVRIAPIPDEISTVGIEVPNKIVNTVSLREIIESSNFEKAVSKLSFAIGKDIGGNSIIGDISKLPHMLIAGTTGSGKSVCMNSLIISLLYKAKPDEVRFIMIDPKMVELGIYNSIPHLYVPVVTEPKKAAGALQWAVVEMLKRYRLFSEAGVRDLSTYNGYCEHEGDPKLPNVVIVIDELADLMMAASKEVEESICRIAQMGRAAGMHLIIATQRPSADVITGLMKANIPSRIAFAVSSAMESRIIMDQSGAEKLVGHGDMLYSPIGCGKPLRVQGAFVSDSEREKVIKFISDNCDIKFEENEDLKNAMEAASSESSNSSSKNNDNHGSESMASEYDDMLPQAVEIVLEMKSCSVSMLQRRLKLGYSRAARIVDQMEELGVVGPYQGAKPRDLAIDRNEWNNIQIRLGFASEDDFAVASEMNESFTEEDNSLI